MNEDIAAFVITIVSIAVLGLFAWNRHEKTHKKLDRIHEDLQGGMESLQMRHDRAESERTWGLQHIRSALETLRLHIIALFKSKP